MYKKHSLEQQQQYSSSFQSDNYQNRYSGNEHFQSDSSLQGIEFRGQQGSSSSGRGRSVRADHLLNFQYQNSGNQRMHQWRRNNNNRNNGYYRNNNYRQPKYSKEQYIQANFKFYVSDCIDLEKHSKDPDLAFVWDDVAWVEMMTDSEFQCPISLESPPFCPQITPCGHLFSFPQIVHYLYLQDNTLKTPHPCPLCFTPLTARELRDVRVRTVQNAVVGQNMEFVLVRREKNKQMVEVVDGDDFFQSHFSKFVPISDATDIYVDTVKRLAEKASQAIKEGGSEVADEVPYLYTCVDVTAIKARQWTFKRAKLQVNPQQVVGSESSKDIADMNQRADAVEAFVREAFMKTDLQGTSNQSTSDNTHIHVKKSIHHNQSQKNNSDHASNFYYFYQCADGQQIFLLPMNAKCVLAQYGAWENCPRRVSGQVLEVEEHVQGEEERKRWKFLAHIPQSSSFKFCEIKMDLEEFPATSQFEREIQKRQRTREKLAAKQAKEDARATPTLAEHVYPASSYVPIPSITEWQSMPALSTTNTNNNDNTNNEGNSPPRPGVSFANITRLGYAVTSAKEDLTHDTIVEVEENKWTDLLASNSSGKKESDKSTQSGKKTFKGKVKGKKLSLSSFQRRS